MASLEKRRCISFSMNHFLSSLDATCLRIAEAHQQSSQMAREESISYMERLARGYIIKKKSQLSSSHPQNEQAPRISHDQLEKKSLIEDNSKKNERAFSFDSNKKAHSHNCKTSQKKGTLRLKEKLERISEGMERHNINDYLSSQDQDNHDPARHQNAHHQNVNHQNVNHFNQIPANKPLSELIQESIKKAKIDSQQQARLESDQSEYEMTDYSSNESSNENIYEEVHQYDFEDRPLFAGIFSKAQGESEGENSQTFKTQSTHNIAFRPQGLIYSPKKNKEERKRVYMNNKRIPKWAQSKEEIARIAQKQSLNPLFDAKRIYGRCVVERLDTNVIFKSNEEIVRNSSAKWNKILKSN